MRTSKVLNSVCKRFCCSGVAWRQAGPLRRASFAAACLLWPIAAAAMAARETWRSGSALARRLGKGRCRQFLEQYQLALRHGILPRYYYVFELHDPALRAVAADYLHRFETKGGVVRPMPVKKQRFVSNRIEDDILEKTPTSTKRPPPHMLN